MKKIISISKVLTLRNPLTPETVRMMCELVSHNVRRAGDEKNTPR